MNNLNRHSGKIILLILMLLSCAFLNAEEMTVHDGLFEMRIFYNSVAYSGDAVFVRLELTPGGNGTVQNFNARLSLLVNGKVSRKSDFYRIPSSGTASVTMLTGIPLSSWWTSGSSYSLELSYSAEGKNRTVRTLPLTLLDKTFVSETIELDDRNTGIKTDSSAQRMEQIRNLNEILATVNPDAVYHTKAFSKPVDSSYRTSFFADRRVYAYSSGGSSTSLHYGIDFRAAEGTSVYSCGRGRVVLAGWRNSTGWSIVIEHLPGLYSLYYHLSEMLVEEGDIVDEGTLIARSGSTGLATGPHLHWEIRLNTEAVSPDFFTADFAYEPDARP